MTEYLLTKAPLPRFPGIPVKNPFQGAKKFTGIPTIAATAVLYLGIGLSLYQLIPRMDVGKREMVFFLCFAVTVRSSVRIAGGSWSSPFCSLPRSSRFR